MMMLDDYAFTWDPDRFTIPKTEKLTGVVQTWLSGAVFTFGSSIIGKQITLEWDWLEIAQWNALEAIYLQENEVYWAPGDGSEYSVQVLSLDGVFFDTVAYDAPRRKDVRVVLMIMDLWSLS